MRNERDHANVRTKTPISRAAREMVLPPVGRELVGGTGWGENCRSLLVLFACHRLNRADKRFLRTVALE